MNILQLFTERMMLIRKGALKGSQHTHGRRKYFGFVLHFQTIPLRKPTNHIFMFSSVFVKIGESFYNPGNDFFWSELLLRINWGTLNPDRQNNAGIGFPARFGLGKVVIWSLLSR